VIVDEYDPAIVFFTGVLGFELVEDSPSLTNDGRPKRWVVVRPPGGQTGLLLARADGEQQSATVGHQAAGRVGFCLRVDHFDAMYCRMTEAGVTFVRAPRTEPYGRVAVFLDIAGNRCLSEGAYVQTLLLSWRAALPTRWTASHIRGAPTMLGSSQKVGRGSRSHRGSSGPLST
jgi:catechol 2,3-dioxygenase-like lactoylglutathione lyase family enzyme